MILSCNNICLSFGTETILDQISFHIEDHEKAAIVGINGAGKSTLLKIIMDELTPDTGDVTIGKSKSVGYLAQHQNITSEHTIYEALMDVKKDVLILYEKLRALEHQMKDAKSAALESMYAAYDRMNHAFEQANGYAVSSEVTGVLKGLGFTEDDFSKKVATLSGGQKTRVALGRLLLTKPDIILLDEPTNHLDMRAIAWLETYLQNYDGAVIIVAHDRYFLDKVVTKIIEIEHHRGHVYQGNYTSFAQKKAMLRDAALKAYINQQRDIQHQEEVIAKLKSFNREKSIKRAESREKMLAKKTLLEKPVEEDTYMNLNLEPDIISGNDVLHVEELSKGFNEHMLFSNISFDIRRQEKVAIIGDNGTGKTTILKIINGLLPPDTGIVSLGTNVHIGYFDQEHHVLDMDKTIFDEIADTYPTLGNTRIRNILAAFLFTNDDVFKYIRDLSGGECSRVSLAKLMLSDANLLILDEPTNHLDITSKEILEKALNAYTGTLLYVSHDRYFINQTATRILELSENGLANYNGNYDYYIEKYDSPSVSESSGQAVTLAPEVVSDTESSRMDYKKQKEIQALRRKKENRLKQTLARIDAVEERQQALDELLLQPDICTNASRLLEITTEKDALDEETLTLMTTWEELEAELSEETD